MAITIGIDTSNYTTSMAYFDGESGKNIGRLLDVPEGALGLRQSDALFQHVKKLPSIANALWEDVAERDIVAICASTKPRELEDSYMPCFLAGESQGRVLAETMQLPFFACSHQQGHVAAAAWSAGRMDLLDRPHLAWHLSGGTTELLYVEPMGLLVKAVEIGGTSDISAGQLIDRTGKKLGLPFPAGRAVDALSLEATKETHFPVKVQKGRFSLSGIENKMNAMVDAGENPADVCRFVLGSIIHAVGKATAQIMGEYPKLPVLCAGGVASNALLREKMAKQYGAIFAQPQYSTDNAMGVAILAHRLWSEGQNG